MKRTSIYFTILLAVMLSFLGCEEYLEVPVEAGLAEEDIFSTYNGFQGFQDEIIELIVDYNRHGARRSHAIGGEALAYSGFSVTRANLGLYAQTGGGLMDAYSIFLPHDEGSANEESHSGLYTHMWKAVRIANICLDRLESDILSEATDQQRKWLKGQAL